MYTILKLAGDEFKDNERQVKMLSNRDDKHNEHEESEYHFSDDDVSYEVETESSKPAASGGGAGLMSRLTGSKRMLISLGVFLLLVFVVYKMVAPTSTTPPPTDFSPEAAAPAPTPQIATAAAPQPTATPQNVEASPQTQAPVAEQKPAPQNPEVVVGMPAVIPVQSTVPAAPAPAPTPTTTTTTTNVAAAPPANTPPPPIPSDAMAASTPNAPPVVMVTNAPAPAAPPVATGMDSAMASMVSTNEKLIGQMQADFNQRLNDYAGQTKAMQGQLESLSARVVNMEAQLNQLVQTLSRTAQPTSPMAPPPAVQQPAVPVSSAPDIKISYNVQAIIPGRAWLRSESGETVTVAEGDSIKDLGRVTKIDPYDGIVEVNTGNKVVSISYGNSE